MKNLEKIFKVLGNRRRLEILRLLIKNNELSVKAVAKQFKVKIQSASDHMVQLDKLNFLNRRRDKNHHFYFINKEMNNIQKILFDIIKNN